MDIEAGVLVTTGVAALAFAATFLWGNYIHPVRALITDRRSIISFAAGMSAAYVFVHLMPELHGARSAFTESVGMQLPYEGVAIYFLALIGFLSFYGLEHLRNRLHSATESEQEHLGYRLHISGFASYVWLMGYLLVHNLEHSHVAIGFYAIAVLFHFLTVDHTLREEHGAMYQRNGRFMLAGAALLGWGAALLFALPHHVLALLVAFISGAIIMNSVIMELPSEKNGRFLPFMMGGILYGLILVPLG